MPRVLRDNRGRFVALMSSVQKMENEVAVNIAEVRVRIAEAAQRAGRKPEEITLIAVTKTVKPARIAEAYQAGVRDFGENYVQESLTKIGHPPLEFPDMRWHFIGHLQSNKAKEVVGHFALVQSVDSLSLAKELARREIGRASCRERV